MNNDTRLKMAVEWSEQLSVRLGRPAEEIRKHGLFAGDFPCDHELRIEFEDSSFMQFAHAFHVFSKDERTVAVFTEHCGYHVFFALPLTIMLIKTEVRYRGKWVDTDSED